MRMITGKGSKSKRKKKRKESVGNSLRWMTHNLTPFYYEILWKKTIKILVSTKKVEWSDNENLELGN